MNINSHSILEKSFDLSHKRNLSEIYPQSISTENAQKYSFL